MNRFRTTICLSILVISSTPIGRAETPSAGPASIAQRKSGDDWPDFLGPQRNGKSTERGLPDNWPKEGLPIVWQQPIGTTYAAPTISGGRLFHFSRMGDAARLTCRNAETGDLLWKCEYPTDYVDLLGYNNGPRSTPVVDGPYVFSLGAEGILQCVRAADGQMLWRIDTTKQFNVVKNFFGVGSTPLVWGDLLIVNVGGSPPGGPSDVYAAGGRVKTNNCAVAAFEKVTGKLRWTTGEDLASYASPVLAKIDGRDIVFMLARAGLLAVDPSHGKTLAHYPWRAQKLESVNASSPVIVGDEVFISETYELGSALVRFTGKSFEEIWTDRARRRNRSMALHWNTPIVHKGFIYGSSGYHTPEAELRCVDWKTGNVVWSETGMGRSSLLLVDGVLVCLSEEGTLRIIRAISRQYEELAKWELADKSGAPLLKYPAWTAPALARGLLYVQGADRLICLELLKQR